MSGVRWSSFQMRAVQSPRLRKYLTENGFLCVLVVYVCVLCVGECARLRAVQSPRQKVLDREWVPAGSHASAQRVVNCCELLKANACIQGSSTRCMTSRSRPLIIVPLLRTCTAP